MTSLADPTAAPAAPQSAAARGTLTAVDRPTSEPIAEPGQAVPGLGGPILEAQSLTKRYQLGGAVIEALRGVSLTVREGRVRGDHGPVRLGQEHAAPDPRRPRPADHGRGRPRRRDDHLDVG